MNNWQEAKLGDVCSIIDGDRGKNYPKENDFSKSGYCLFLNTKNVPNTKFDFSDCLFISEEKDNSLRKGKIKYGDIVVTTRGTLANFAYYTQDCKFKNIIINSGMVILRNEKQCIYTPYLYHFLMSINFKQQVNSFASGSAQPQLPIKDMKNIAIPFPPVDMQRKIAEVLRVLDAKIELNNAINNNLEQQAQALFKSWFVDKFNPNRKTIKAEEIFNISIGKTPPRKEPEWFSENPNNIKWVSISDMGSCGMYISDSSEYLIPSAISKFNIKIVPSNTVLLSFKLTVGRIAITDGEMTTNEAIAHFITNRTEINEYLYCYLRNFNFQTMGSTSSIATAVNSKIIKSMPFVMPEENELKDFHSVVSPTFAQIKFNQSESTRLAQLRDALLPKLMSGEIDVSNVNIDDLASADKLSFIIIYVLLRFVTQKTFKRTLST